MNDRKDTLRFRIDGLLKKLPQEIAPSADLWPAVEARIRDRSTDPARRLSRLPQDITPPDDLWAGIASMLERERPQRPAGPVVWWSGMARVAASVAFVAIAGLALLRLATVGGPGAPGALENRRASLPDVETAWLAPGAFGFARASSSPMTAAFEEARLTYADEIMAVRKEREAIEASLALYPDDAALRELWLHAYETELLLVDEAGRVLTFIQTG